MNDSRIIILLLIKEDAGIDENYEGYDDNIDDDYLADPLYEEGSSTAINSGRSFVLWPLDLYGGGGGGGFGKKKMEGIL